MTANKNNRPNILSRLWRRWDTRLCLIVILAYAGAALYGEAVYRAARLTDRTPAYNAVREQSRYVTPAVTASISLTQLWRK